MAKRVSRHGEDGLGRHSPPTRRRTTDGAVEAETGRPRTHPALTLTGAGALATTGLFGFGMLTASEAGAVSGHAGTQAGSGDTANGVAFSESQNAGNELIAANPAFTTSDETTCSAPFGIGAKTTTLTTQAVGIQWKVLQGLIEFRGQLTSSQPFPPFASCGVAGQTITFTLSSGFGKSCQAITDPNGVAQCNVTLVPLSLLFWMRSYTANFEGTSSYESSDASGTVQVELH